MPEAYSVYCNPATFESLLTFTLTLIIYRVFVNEYL